jgi:hypothetical protein
VDRLAPTAVLYAAAEHVLAESLAAQFGKDPTDLATIVDLPHGRLATLALDERPAERVPTFHELAEALIASGAVLAAPWLTNELLAKRVTMIAFGWQEGQPGFADALITVEKILESLTLVLGRGL